MSPVRKGPDSPDIVQIEKQSDGKTSNRRKYATPASKAKKVLMLERARQRTIMRRMSATRKEASLTRHVLQALLSDAAFVALLRSRGFISMPELVHRLLVEQRS